MVATMSRLRAWLVPPLDAGPRRTLEWARRIEIWTGAASLVRGLASWSQGWWHWILIVMGLLSISPWPGVRQILRKADTKPMALSYDRDRGYRRAKRTYVSLVPAFTLCAGAAGYAYGRWLGAAINIVLIGTGGGLGGWLALRQMRTSRDD